MNAAAVVVNFNGGDDLPQCLAALAAQSVAVTTVVVDCASTDGSRRWAEQPPPGVHGVPLPTNRGYAGGCNAGLAVVPLGVDAIGFFNPDCFPGPGFIAACLDVLERRREVGGVAGRLERPDGTLLDSCGQRLTRLFLRVHDRGYGEPADGAFTEPARVLAACGAAMVYRRAALDSVRVEGEVFPDEFFAFWEDLDLGWRVSNRGWQIVYEPGAVAVHRRAATAAPGRGRLIFRRSSERAADIAVNGWATLLRNLHPIDFWLRAPLLLPVEMAMLAWLLLRRPRVLPALAARLSRLRTAARARRALPQYRLAELQ
jgi:GT2 family glycosyltransferase